MSSMFGWTSFWQQKPADEKKQDPSEFEVTTKPLWHMGQVATFGSKSSLKILQDSIDHLTSKAKFKKTFTEDEKEFMKNLFEALWWGGYAKWYPEAAALANHYVTGEEESLEISATPYQESVIVSDTMKALKRYIRELAAAKKPYGQLHSGEPGFLRTAFVRDTFLNPNPARDVDTKGRLNKEGVLLVEQINARLKNTDHQFYLTVKTKPATAGKFESIWRVDSIYDFEPFDKADYVTHITLAKGMILKLPDGLSHYLTTIGVAKAFDYWAEWKETWP